MKTIIVYLLTILFAIYLSSCSDNTVTPTSSGNETIVSGKIQNWNLGSNKKIFAKAERADSNNISVVLDSCTVDSAGNFELHLRVPPDSIMSLFKIGGDTMCTNHTVVNPGNLKYCFMYPEIEDSLHNYIGYAYMSNDTLSLPHTGKITSNIYYFNNSGSIAGTDTCFYNPVLLIETNNVAQTKGWNYIYVIYNLYSANLVQVTATSQTQDVKWYCQRIYDSHAKQNKPVWKHYFMKDN